jgi:putative hydrolase of the HAD superfamily
VSGQLVGSIQDGRIQAVVFDLDDTLYPQSEFLAGAFEAVADRATSMGFDRDRLLRALFDAASKGTDRGTLIDEAVQATADVGGGPPWGTPPDVVKTVLVPVFRNFRPRTLELTAGAKELLSTVASRASTALLTDGDVCLQRAKIKALGLEDAFDKVVITDFYGGRQCRKPAPVGFLAALTALGVAPQDAVMVGDRVDKDVVGAQRVGMQVLRVRAGEWAHVSTPEGVPEVSNLHEALAALAGQ